MVNAGDSTALYYRSFREPENNEYSSLAAPPDLPEFRGDMTFLVVAEAVIPGTPA